MVAEKRARPKLQLQEREQQHRPHARPLQGALLIPTDQVERDPDQPRRDWSHDRGEERLRDLTQSIEEFGVLQPLIVRAEGVLEDGRQRFVVIAGGRRLVAAQRAGLAEVPVIVHGEQGALVHVMQLVENLQRQELSAMDEARAFQQLMDLEQIGPEGVARRVHLSSNHVRQRLRFLSDHVIGDAIQRGQIAPSVGREIQKLEDGAREELRARVESGERLQLADVERKRSELDAAGVSNPRFPGGGRPAAVDLDLAYKRPVVTVETSGGSGDDVRTLFAPARGEVGFTTARFVEGAVAPPARKAPVVRPDDLAELGLPALPPLPAEGDEGDEGDADLGRSALNRLAAQDLNQDAILGMALQDLSWEPLEALLQYAGDRGWSALGTLQALREKRAGLRR